VKLVTGLFGSQLLVEDELTRVLLQVVVDVVSAVARLKRMVAHFYAVRVHRVLLQRDLVHVFRVRYFALPELPVVVPWRFSSDFLWLLVILFKAFFN